jgi:hypothetical protein
MDLSRAVYSRDLKIATMRALDAGSTNGGVARKYKIKPEAAGTLARRMARQRESAFPGIKKPTFALPSHNIAWRPIYRRGT